MKIFPASLVASVLLLSITGALGATLDLALELYSEGQWRASRIEARRALAGDPDNAEARVLVAVCSLKLGERLAESRSTLAEIADDDSTATGLRSLAAYELGRAHWSAGEHRHAYDRLVFAFMHASCPDLYLRAGCTLFLLMRAEKSLRDISESVNAQIAANRRMYNWELQQECRIEEPSAGSLLSKPGEWTVKLYRSQIGPAIGMRCHCVPSCSEYFLQACRKHGMLGFAIMADRFYREPSVVQEKRHPVVVGDEIRYADPLSDHDFWLRSSSDD